MSEDCQSCGTAMFELDEDRLCPGCSDVHYIWEEAEYMENKLFYEYDGSDMLRNLEELPTKGKM